MAQGFPAQVSPVQGLPVQGLPVPVITARFLWSGSWSLAQSADPF